MIDAIVNAASAPFQSQVGMQGFAYGLLGLRALRKMYSFLAERNGNSEK